VGYNTLYHISKVLAGESYDISCIEEELTAGDLVCFKYAPVVSVDVERSFSRYKNVLSDNRRFLTFDNLHQLVVVYCNNAELGKISYLCTLVNRNKHVLYCDAVKLTQNVLCNLYVISAHLKSFYVVFIDLLSHFIYHF
jgi:hypothetical protein